MATTTLRKFVTDLDNVIQQTQVSMALKLAKGQCASMEDYKREVGRMEGLSLAITTARDMLGKVEAADDFDNKLPEMTQEKTVGNK